MFINNVSEFTIIVTDLLTGTAQKIAIIELISLTEAPNTKGAPANLNGVSLCVK